MSDEGLRKELETVDVVLAPPRRIGLKAGVFIAGAVTVGIAGIVANEKHIEYCEERDQALLRQASEKYRNELIDMVVITNNIFESCERGKIPMFAGFRNRRELIENVSKHTGAPDYVLATLVHNVNPYHSTKNISHIPAHFAGVDGMTLHTDMEQSLLAAARKYRSVLEECDGDEEKALCITFIGGIWHTSDGVYTDESRAEVRRAQQRALAQIKGGPALRRGVRGFVSYQTDPKQSEWYLTECWDAIQALKLKRDGIDYED